MHKLLLLTLGVLMMALLVPLSQSTDARQGPPQDIPEQGLIYGGLTPAEQGRCKGGFEMRINANGASRIFCTTGPERPPAGYSVNKRVKPLSRESRAASAAVCTGDGTSGKRIQVLFVRASDAPSRFAEYFPSLQTWLGEADAVFDNSAAKTGGSRHIRYVHGADCQPIIEEVAVPSASLSTFGGLINELWVRGYNRSDRNYLMFVDARAYCGIATYEYDDRPGPENYSNLGPHFARIDAGCWSGTIAAHELMHNLGGVQLSAPNSDGGSHCNDGYDTMCSYSGHVTSLVCPDPASVHLFDCGGEDYFNTNPPAGSYLASHWNTANSVYLMAPTAPPPTVTSPPTATPLPTATTPPTATPMPTNTPPPTATPSPTATLPPTDTPPPTATLPPTDTPPPTATLPPTDTPPPTATLPPTDTPPPTAIVLPTEAPPPALVMRADLLRSGRVKRYTFTPSDTFSRGQDVGFQVRIVDQDDAVLSGVSVTITVTRPDGVTACTISVTTNGSGLAVGECEIPRRSPLGQWMGHIVSMKKGAYTPDMAGSMLDDDFWVR